MLERLPLEQLEKTSNDVKWESSYSAAKQYYQENGTLSTVPKSYVSKSGARLGVWLIAQRRARRLGKLSEDRIRLLDELEFEWMLETPFEKGLHYAKAYFREHGNLAIPKTYVTPDGYRLSQRRMNQLMMLKRGKANDERISMLRQVGIEI